MPHHIAVSLSVWETNCLSPEQSHLAWLGHGESLLHFVYMSEKEREGERATPLTVIYLERDLPAAVTPPSACLASVLPPKMSAHRSGHSRVIRESCHSPLSPHPCRKIERDTLVRASSAQKQPPSPQLLIMETNSGETAPTKHVPVIKHKEVCSKRNSCMDFPCLRWSMQIMYTFSDDPRNVQTGRCSKEDTMVCFDSSCSVSLPCKYTSDIALIQTLVNSLTAYR